MASLQKTEPWPDPFLTQSAWLQTSIGQAVSRRKSDSDLRTHTCARCRHARLACEAPPTSLRTNTRYAHSRRTVSYVQNKETHSASMTPLDLPCNCRPVSGQFSRIDGILRRLTVRIPLGRAPR